MAVANRIRLVIISKRWNATTTTTNNNNNNNNNNQNNNKLDLKLHTNRNNLKSPETRVSESHSGWVDAIFQFICRGVSPIPI